MHSHDGQDHSHPDLLQSGGSDGLRILAIDVGAGTQDVLVYDSRTTPENSVKLVLPSQTQIVARRIRAATAAHKPVHLTGQLMGGGASSGAAHDHLAHGLRVTSTAEAARTLHNDPARVAKLGVEICKEAPADAVEIRLQDVDLDGLAHALATFDVDLPATVAIAVQDHGFRPGAGNNAVRFEYLQGLLDNGGDLAAMIYQVPPAGMTRMEAVAETAPGCYLMDTGAAAVLGALGDPVVARAAEDDGAILINVGNMHTFATLVKNRRLYGLFEHHTGGISAEIIHELVELLRGGRIDASRFHEEFDGHGAALNPTYLSEQPFQFVAVTGPNREIARSLGYHEAAPHGDMMLSGAFGLVEGVLLALEGSNQRIGHSLIAKAL
ncbi:MAG: DUF1786 domain-containing protein [Thermomicrobiales bacterium]